MSGNEKVRHRVEGHEDDGLRNADGARDARMEIPVNDGAVFTVDGDGDMHAAHHESGAVDRGDSEADGVGAVVAAGQQFPDYTVSGTHQPGISHSVRYGHRGEAYPRGVMAARMESEMRMRLKMSRFSVQKARVCRVRRSWTMRVAWSS